MSTVVTVVPVEAGELSCGAHNDADYPGLTIQLNERQLVVIEQPKGVGMVRVHIWADPDDESPSHTVEVRP